MGLKEQNDKLHKKITRMIRLYKNDAKNLVDLVHKNETYKVDKRLVPLCTEILNANIQIHSIEFTAIDQFGLHFSDEKESLHFHEIIGNDEIGNKLIEEWYYSLEAISSDDVDVYDDEIGFIQYVYDFAILIPTDDIDALCKIMSEFNKRIHEAVIARKKEIETKQVILKHNGVAVPMEKFIAPLISELWKAGIETDLSYENKKYEDNVGIHFSSLKNGKKFINIVGKKADKQLLTRINPGPGIQDGWLYNTSVKCKPHDRSDKFTLSLLVRFPQKDFETVLKQFKSYNEQKEKTEDSPCLIYIILFIYFILSHIICPPMIIPTPSSNLSTTY